MSSMKSPIIGPRTLVLCFDGTDEQFQNTNVIKLFSLLEKDSDEQLVYYQPGIGTYAAPGVMAGIRKWFAKLADQAVAWYLDIHVMRGSVLPSTFILTCVNCLNQVMGGYSFLMQNYRQGDRICLIGFSRGAYTARALAGMVHKVKQVGFAYNIYKQTGKTNVNLATDFRQTFSKPIPIDFVGCWDTISSVGLLFSKHFPFTIGNSSIKYFRHALSLDEHRARFQPNLYHRVSPSAKAARKDPEHSSYPEKSPTSPGPETDVLEVWFPGCHTDIGGGTTPSPKLGSNTPSLSDITLHWMIRQMVITQCGVIFNNDSLTAAGIPLSMLSTTASDKNALIEMRNTDKKVLMDDDSSSLPSPLYSPAAAKEDARDAIQPLHDSLKTTPVWWILEIFPFVLSWQDESGVWHRDWRWNLGRPRRIYSPVVNLHITVRERMEDESLKYTPRAVWKNKPDAVWCY
ncbi:hypothetical protein Clacol_002253 [Clathrus columnatus]|uniref:T6SS Phospholipase effector Tle1-like catalytic domain-containing protein n=1 Tax=Clathrus columnatus TaxID=1419009 RepID=A0AAV5A650_9AGAM|nr:hypothetical protein Clacol_002253 [Clathrus columnatus]